MNISPQAHAMRHLTRCRGAASTLLLCCAPALLTGCMFELDTGLGSIKYSNENFGGLGLLRHSSTGAVTRMGTSGDVFDTGERWRYPVRPAPPGKSGSRE